jgi:hypothetical protein
LDSKKFIKKSSILSFIAICIVEVHCQTSPLKVGAYRNIIEFNKQTPFYANTFIFRKKKNDNIPELYTVKSNDTLTNGGIIKNSIWCIFDGENFYLNAHRIGMTDGYIRIDTLKKYSYFKGLPIATINQQSRMRNSVINFGLTGYAVSSLLISGENQRNVHYVLNSQNGMVNLLTNEYLTILLQPYSELLLNYQQEEDYESIEILLKYLDLINKQSELKSIQLRSCRHSL